METAYKEGDRVQIVDREATADDVKTSLFFNHFRGLTGTVQKLYANEDAAIEIENGALPEPVALRHHEVQEKMKADWLDKLSEEAKGRLSPQERDFRLRYTILVRVADLTSPTGPVPTAHATPPRRMTEAEITAAEEAELARRNNGR